MTADLALAFVACGTAAGAAGFALGSLRCGLWRGRALALIDERPDSDMSADAVAWRKRTVDLVTRLFGWDVPRG